MTEEEKQIDWVRTPCKTRAGVGVWVDSQDNKYVRGFVEATSHRDATRYIWRLDGSGTISEFDLTPTGQIVYVGDPEYRRDCDTCKHGEFVDNFGPQCNSEDCSFEDCCYPDYPYWESKKSADKPQAQVLPDHECEWKLIVETQDANLKRVAANRDRLQAIAIGQMEVINELQGEIAELEQIISTHDSLFEAFINGSKRNEMQIINLGILASTQKLAIAELKRQLAWLEGCYEDQGKTVYNLVYHRSQLEAERDELKAKCPPDDVLDVLSNYVEDHKSCSLHPISSATQLIARCRKWQASKEKS